MTELLLIRHGATEGNLERRYIGAADQPLCPLGETRVLTLGARLRESGLDRPGAVFSSPLRRAVRTAALLFPDRPPQLLPELRETDFGPFEGKTADELAEDPRYRAWVDSGCMAPIPGGEDIASFRRRCVRAFVRAAEDLPPEGLAAFVFHGGGIMAVLAALGEPRRDFYAWSLPNASAWRCRWDGARLFPLSGPLRGTKRS